MFAFVLLAPVQIFSNECFSKWGLDYGKWMMARERKKRFPFILRWFISEYGGKRRFSFDLNESNSSNKIGWKRKRKNRGEWEEIKWKINERWKNRIRTAFFIAMREVFGGEAGDHEMINEDKWQWCWQIWFWDRTFKRTGQALRSALKFEKPALRFEKPALKFEKLHRSLKNGVEVRKWHQSSKIALSPFTTRQSLVKVALIFGYCDFSFISVLKNHFLSPDKHKRKNKNRNHMMRKLMFPNFQFNFM